MSLRRCAWLASQPSLDIGRWTRVIDRAKVTPLFVQIGGELRAAREVMSFACARDPDALRDLLRVLEVDALITGGIDILPLAYAVSKRMDLPLLVCGASESEEDTLRQLLPTQYFDVRQRGHYIVPSAESMVIMARKVERARSHWRAKLVNRLFNRHDVWRDVAKAFADFTGDERLRAWHEQGYLLQPSGNIQRAASHAYRVEFPRAATFTRASLVPMLEAPNETGTLVMDLISPRGEHLRAERALASLNVLSRVDFGFAPISVEAGSAWEVRIAVHQGTQPVRLLELRRYRQGGLKVDREPFLLFTET